MGVTCLVLVWLLVHLAFWGPAAWGEGYLATDLQKLPDLVFGVD